MKLSQENDYQVTRKVTFSDKVIHHDISDVTIFKKVAAETKAKSAVTPAAIAGTVGTKAAPPSVLKGTAKPGLQSITKTVINTAAVAKAAAAANAAAAVAAKKPATTTTTVAKTPTTVTVTTASKTVTTTKAVSAVTSITTAASAKSTTTTTAATKTVTTTKTTAATKSTVATATAVKETAPKPTAAVTKETPAAAVTRETPAAAITKETPAAAVTKETPAAAVTKEIPAKATASVETKPTAKIIDATKKQDPKKIEEDILKSIEQVCKENLQSADPELEKIISAEPAKEKPQEKTVKTAPRPLKRTFEPEKVESVDPNKSKKLDIKAYKQRLLERQKREQEKAKQIESNPASLTQNLLNIPSKKRDSDSPAQATKTPQVTANNVEVKTDKSNAESTKSTKPAIKLKRTSLHERMKEKMAQAELMEKENKKKTEETGKTSTGTTDADKATPDKCSGHHGDAKLDKLKKKKKVCEACNKFKNIKSEGSKELKLKSPKSKSAETSEKSENKTLTKKSETSEMDLKLKEKSKAVKSSTHPYSNNEAQSMDTAENVGGESVFVDSSCIETEVVDSRMELVDGEMVMMPDINVFTNDNLPDTVPDEEINRYIDQNISMAPVLIGDEIDEAMDVAEEVVTTSGLLPSKILQLCEAPLTDNGEEPNLDNMEELLQDFIDVTGEEMQKIKEDEKERCRKIEEEKRRREEERRRKEEEERRKAEEERLRIEEEKRKAEEERLRIEEEKRKEEEEKRKAEEERLRIEEEKRRIEEEMRKKQEEEERLRIEAEQKRIEEELRKAEEERMCKEEEMKALMDKLEKENAAKQVTSVSEVRKISESEQIDDIMKELNDTKVMDDSFTVESVNKVENSAKKNIVLETIELSNASEAKSIGESMSSRDNFVIDIRSQSVESTANSLPGGCMKDFSNLQQQLQKNENQIEITVPVSKESIMQSVNKDMGEESLREFVNKEIICPITDENEKNDTMNLLQELQTLTEKSQTNSSHAVTKGLKPAKLEEIKKHSQPVYEDISNSPNPHQNYEGLEDYKISDSLNQLHGTQAQSVKGEFESHPSQKIIDVHKESSPPLTDEDGSNLPPIQKDISIIPDSDEEADNADKVIEALEKSDELEPIDDVFGDPKPEEIPKLLAEEVPIIAQEIELPVNLDDPIEKSLLLLDSIKEPVLIESSNSEHVLLPAESFKPTDITATRLTDPRTQPAARARPTLISDTILEKPIIQINKDGSKTLNRNELQTASVSGVQDSETDASGRPAVALHSVTITNSANNKAASSVNSAALSDNIKQTSFDGITDSQSPVDDDSESCAQGLLKQETENREIEKLKEKQKTDLLLTIDKKRPVVLLEKSEDLEIMLTERKENCEPDKNRGLHKILNKPKGKFKAAKPVPTSVGLENLMNPELVKPTTPPSRYTWMGIVNQMNEINRGMLELWYKKCELFQQLPTVYDDSVTDEEKKQAEAAAMGGFNMGFNPLSMMMMPGMPMMSQAVDSKKQQEAAATTGMNLGFNPLSMMSMMPGMPMIPGMMSSTSALQQPKKSEASESEASALDVSDKASEKSTLNEKKTNLSEKDSDKFERRHESRHKNNKEKSRDKKKKKKEKSKDRSNSRHSVSSEMSVEKDKIKTSQKSLKSEMKTTEIKSSKHSKESTTDDSKGSKKTHKDDSSETTPKSKGRIRNSSKNFSDESETESVTRKRLQTPEPPKSKVTPTKSGKSDTKEPHHPPRKMEKTFKDKKTLKSDKEISKILSKDSSDDSDLDLATKSKLSSMQAPKTQRSKSRIGKTSKNSSDSEEDKKKSKKELPRSQSRMSKHSKSTKLSKTVKSKELIDPESDSEKESKTLKHSRSHTVKSTKSSKVSDDEDSKKKSDAESISSRGIKGSSKHSESRRSKPTSPTPKVDSHSKSQTGKLSKSLIDSDSEVEKKHSDEESLSSRRSGSVMSKSKSEVHKSRGEEKNKTNKSDIDSEIEKYTHSRHASLKEVSRSKSSIGKPKTLDSDEESIISRESKFSKRSKSSMEKVTKGKSPVRSSKSEKQKSKLSDSERDHSSSPERPRSKSSLSTLSKGLLDSDDGEPQLKKKSERKRQAKRRIRTLSRDTSDSEDEDGKKKSETETRQPSKKSMSTSKRRHRIRQPSRDSSASDDEDNKKSLSPKKSSPIKEKSVNKTDNDSDHEIGLRAKHSKNRALNDTPILNENDDEMKNSDVESFVNRKPESARSSVSRADDKTSKSIGKSPVKSQELTRQMVDAIAKDFSDDDTGIQVVSEKELEKSREPEKIEDGKSLESKHESPKKKSDDEDTKSTKEDADQSKKKSLNLEKLSKDKNEKSEKETSLESKVKGDLDKDLKVDKINEKQSITSSPAASCSKSNIDKTSKDIDHNQIESVQKEIVVASQSKVDEIKDSHKAIIYSDDSTQDTLEPSTSKGKESGKALALLEESLKKESKKQKTSLKYLLNPQQNKPEESDLSSIEDPEEFEVSPKKKSKSVTLPPEVLKHYDDTIDFVIKNFGLVSPTPETDSSKESSSKTTVERDDKKKSETNITEFKTTELEDVSEGELVIDSPVPEKMIEFISVDAEEKDSKSTKGPEDVIESVEDDEENQSEDEVKVIDIDVPFTYEGSPYVVLDAIDEAPDAEIPTEEYNGKDDNVTAPFTYEGMPLPKEAIDNCSSVGSPSNNPSPDGIESSLKVTQETKSKKLEIDNRKANKDQEDSDTEIDVGKEELDDSMMRKDVEGPEMEKGGVEKIGESSKETDEEDSEPMKKKLEKVSRQKSKKESIKSTKKFADQNKDSTSKKSKKSKALSKEFIKDSDSEKSNRSDNDNETDKEETKSVKSGKIKNPIKKSSAKKIYSDSDKFTDSDEEDSKKIKLKNTKRKKVELSSKKRKAESESDKSEDEVKDNESDEEVYKSSRKRNKFTRPSKRQKKENVKDSRRRGRTKKTVEDQSSDEESISSKRGRRQKNKQTETKSRRNLKRKPPMSDEQMKSCKVRIIDCKYTLLKENVSKNTLRKVGISKIRNLKTIFLNRSNKTEISQKRPTVNTREKQTAVNLKAENSKKKEVRDDSKLIEKNFDSEDNQQITNVKNKEVKSDLKQNEVVDFDKKEESNVNKEVKLDSEQEDIEIDSSNEAKKSDSEQKEKIADSEEIKELVNIQHKETKSDLKQKEVEKDSEEENKQPEPKDKELKSKKDDKSVDKNTLYEEETPKIQENKEKPTMEVPLNKKDKESETSKSKEDKKSTPFPIKHSEESKKLSQLTEGQSTPMKQKTPTPSESSSSTLDVSLEQAQPKKPLLNCKGNQLAKVQVVVEKMKMPMKTTAIDETVKPGASEEKDESKSKRISYSSHTGPILHIKVFEDTFLAASDNGSVYQYEMSKDVLIKTFRGHSDAVTCLCISCYVDKHGVKHELMCSGSLDRSLRCYNIRTGEEVEVRELESPIQCMELSWDTIYIGTKSGNILSFSVQSRSLKTILDDRTKKHILPSIMALKATKEGARKVLIVAARAERLAIRDADSGLLLRTISGEENYTIYSLLREKSLIYCGTSNRWLPVFDFITGVQTEKYNASIGIVCMCLCKHLLFAGCYDGNIYVFDTKNKNLVCSIPGPGNMLLSMELVDRRIIAGSKNRNLHIWEMPDHILELLDGKP